MINKILLNRKMKVLLETEKENKKVVKTPANKSIIATVIKNIEPLGFVLSKNVIKELSNYSTGYIKEWYRELVDILKEMVGAHVKHKPMYPNFPEQVMEMAEAELYINAIIHYMDSILLGTPDPWLPEYPVEKRPKLTGNMKLKVIDLGNREEFNEIFKNLFNSKVAFSSTDKENIDWFIKENWRIVTDLLPDVFTNKENLAYIVSKLKNYEILTDKVLSTYFKTATDVLRLITALSEGDVSLATNTKYKKFKRSDRKLFLRIMENIHYIEEDMVRYKDRWIRIGEIIHPGEYMSKFPNTYKAFKKIRNNEKIETFNSKVEVYFADEDKKELLKLLVTRPGEFARKLDRTLRTFTAPKTILNNFREIAGKVSSTVLLQVRAHFLNRNENKYRAFFPKGNISKGMLIDNNLPKINEDIIKDVVDICEESLVNMFKSKDKLGKVYIDEALKKCTIPFALRSASKSLKTISKGSHIKMDKGNTIRLFMHWSNIKDKDVIKNSENYYGDHDSGRVDLDLSAMFFDKDFNVMERISYYNLKSEPYRACHSGDITSAPNGASEFIDIDIASAIKYGARYVVMCVNSFTGQMFKNIPECFAGCMIRSKPKSGEIFDPRTVKEKFDLTSESKQVVPIIFDLVENEIIWCDVSINISGIGAGRGNNVDNNKRGITAMGKAFTTLNKPNLYDLFVLHAKARGKIVKDKESADTVFGLYEGNVTPFDIEKITSEYI